MEPKIVRLGNGWAYRVGATTSAPYSTREEAVAAALAHGVEVASGQQGMAPSEPIERKTPQ